MKRILVCLLLIQQPLGLISQVGQRQLLAALPTTSTPILDTGVRANESPLSNGGTWTCPWYGNFDTSLKILSNQIVNASLISSTGDCYWNVQTFGPDSEAFLTVTTCASTNNAIAVGLGSNTEGGNAPNAYGVFMFNNAGTFELDIQKIVGGAFTTLASPTHTCTNGDNIGIKRVGTAITSWYKAAAGSWTQVSSVTDSSVTGAGHLFATIDDTTGAINNFGGGSLIAGVPSAF